ncbi:MAG TPA: 2-succinyl-5-enolpyruvyl-6-hydroxy-3-cyclohexene-1-carboxylic-acid synthase [Propionicimonas sp.]|nr:2-succinyl-5-enolpyruvyl-6-hydroxy-3-cyclohexene-1-carboxylic-acid synthase [Propionicimonas sp.]
MSDSTRCAQLVVSGLLAQGVTDVVLAPGSRSAPLALSLEATARVGAVRLHVRVDERGAGFLALGLAKSSGRPVAVVTTSGTAVGNLLPAVMEAHHSAIPLLVVSADRPSWLVGFGANQTTEQTAIFTGFLSYSATVEAGAPTAAQAAQVARAVLMATGATGGRPGPAQLNVALPEPLVDGAVEPAPVVVPVTAVALADQPPVVLPSGPRTVVVCGDADPGVGQAAVDLATAAGLPLIAEPSSNARRGPHAMATGRLLVAGELGRRVERVVVFGRPTLSRPVNALLSSASVEVIVVSPRPDFVDPGWRARLIVPAVTIAPGSSEWLAAWQQADAEQLRHLHAVTRDTAELTGPELARLVLASTGEGQALCLGNSNPIRDADLVPVAAQPPVVYANRGLSGIDGTLATAIGIALGAAVPTTLLCGDLSFAHDASALAIGPGEARPELRIVVADDDGGSIFATLEYGRSEYADAFERVFATPLGLDLVALSLGYGVSARRLHSAAAVDAALAEPINGLEVLVVPVDRRGRADLSATMSLH